MPVSLGVLLVYGALQSSHLTRENLLDLAVAEQFTWSVTCARTSHSPCRLRRREGEGAEGDQLL